MGLRVRLLRPVGAAAVVALLLAGCGAGDDAATGDAPAGTSTTTTTTTTTADEGATTTSEPGGTLPDDRRAEVLAAAAQRLGVAPAAVEVRSVDAVTWPSGALGCPEPGRFYTQALVEGWQVLVAADDRVLDYRVPVRGGIRLCEGPGAATAGG